MVINHSELATVVFQAATLNKLRVPKGAYISHE